MMICSGLRSEITVDSSCSSIKVFQPSQLTTTHHWRSSLQKLWAVPGKNVWSQNSGCWLLLNRLSSCFLGWWLMTIVNRHDYCEPRQRILRCVCQGVSTSSISFCCTWKVYIYWYTSILDELKLKATWDQLKLDGDFTGESSPNFVWWKWQCWAMQALTEPNPKPKSTKQKSWWSAWKRMPKGWNNGGNCLLHRWYYWKPNLVWHRPFLNFSKRELQVVPTIAIWDVLKAVLASTFLVGRSSPTSPSQSCPCQPCDMAFHSRRDGCAQVRGLEIAHL